MKEIGYAALLLEEQLVFFFCFLSHNLTFLSEATDEKVLLLCICCHWLSHVSYLFTCWEST